MDTGILYCNDNLERLVQMPSESVDLIYLDPPFFSNRLYEVIWGDEAEIRSFEDRWSGGIQNYIEWMSERVAEMHRVLKPTGSLYLHCDPHASHYLKVMLDDTFSPSMFRNEVIWRRTANNKTVDRFGPIHQTILFYAKTHAAKLNAIFTPYTKAYIDGQFRCEDQRGRFRPVLLTGPGTREGESGQPWGGYDPTSAGRHWQPASYLYAKYVTLTGDDLADFPFLKRLNKLDDVGLMYRGKTGTGVPNYRFYLADAPGVPMQDVWAFQPGTEGCLWADESIGIDSDVKWLGSNDAERLGYPTQKPEGLLQRIIEASSNEGDIVLDPFCGCGTTVAVAEHLRRRWIGIDISPTAVTIMARRLWNQSRCVAAIVDVPDSEEALRRLKPFEFQNYIVNALNGTHSPKKSGDMGIDGFSFLTKDPIQVKQSEHPVGRNVIDNFETAMRRGKYDTGYIVAFSFTRGAVEEVARARSDEGLGIKLIKVKEVLLQVKRPGNVLANLGPQPEGDVLPLPPMRKAAELPTAEELIASDRRVAG